MSPDRTNGSPLKSGAGVLGVSAAACAACCAGPILGALSAIGIASAAGYALVGSLALVIGVVAAWVVARRRRLRRTTTKCAPPATTEAFVAAPTIRPTPPPGDTGEPTPDWLAPATLRR